MNKEKKSDIADHTIVFFAVLAAHHVFLGYDAPIYVIFLFTAIFYVLLYLQETVKQKRKDSY